MRHPVRVTYPPLLSQVEPSPPVISPPALTGVQPRTANDVEFQSQTDYIKLRTSDKAESLTHDLTFDLPLPAGYTGGTLNVYVRYTARRDWARDLRVGGKGESVA